MNIRAYILILTYIIASLSVSAQEVVPIEKEVLMAKLKQQNITLKISAKEYQEARAAYRQTNALFLPSLTASHTAMQTTNPLMAFGAKLNQGILTQNDFNPSLLNQPAAVQNVTTLIEVAQPILNVDGVYQRKAAKATMEAKSLQSQRAQSAMEFELQKTYMQLQLAYKRVEVMETSVQAAQENLKVTQQSYQKGYVQKSDVLLVEVRLANLSHQLQAAKSALYTTSEYLSYLVGDTQEIVYKPTESLVPISAPLHQVEFTENRLDVKAMAKATEAYKAMHMADKMTFLPKLNAFGRYEMNDAALFRGGNSGYMVGAQLSWSLFEGSKKIGKRQQSKASLEKANLEYDQYVAKSSMEVQQALRMARDAQNKLALTTLSVQQAEESLRIRKNRFLEGLEKTSDVLDAEAQYAYQQLAYYQTVFEVNYAQLYVQFLTQE